MQELRDVFLDSVEYPSKPDQLKPLDLPDDHIDPAPGGTSSPADMVTPSSAPPASSEGERLDRASLEPADVTPDSSRAQVDDEAATAAIDLDIHYFDTNNASKCRSNQQRRQPKHLGFSTS